MIKIKRVYEPAARDDGRRFLVERLWPRGIRKEALNAEAWMKDVAPSGKLRKWFGHRPERWDEFRKRYWNELDRQPTAWESLAHAAHRGTVTLVYSARDTERNGAVALRDYLIAHR
jgi:uncharacterized protein YeaO (DUF488 family)